MIVRPRLTGKMVAATLVATALLPAASKESSVKRVLLISVDGMHALDFKNCSTGIASINDGTPSCPNLAQLSASGILYLHASTEKPSDSFPGSGALATGGLPSTIGMYYDVSSDRAHVVLT